MFRNPRFVGIVLWLFSWQMIAATSGGLLAKNLWLDLGTALIMFMTACYFFGQSLIGRNVSAYPFMLILIAAASALLTVRICGQAPWRWYDAMIVVAAPQVAVMALSAWLANRRYYADQQLNC